MLQLLTAQLQVPNKTVHLKGRQKYRKMKTSAVCLNSNVHSIRFDLFYKTFYDSVFITYYLLAYLIFFAYKR